MKKNSCRTTNGRRMKEKMAQKAMGPTYSSTLMKSIQRKKLQ